MPFYTDAGKEYPKDCLGTDKNGNTIDILSCPRFGFWDHVPDKNRHQVIEAGNDLAELKAKHGEHKLIDLSKMLAGK